MAEGAGQLPPPPPPPSTVELLHRMENNQQVTNRILEQFTQFVAAGPSGGQGRGGFAAFQHTNPPTFSRAVDPLEADDWLRKVESRLKINQCTNEEMVLFAAHQLEGPAASWWESYLSVQAPGKVITWAEFCEAFRRTHIPESVMEMKAQEFRELKQERTSIGEYLDRFNYLARYAVDEVSTDKKKQLRFRLGLHPEMRKELALLEPRNFEHLVNAALSMENERKEVEKYRKREREAEISARGASQKMRHAPPPPPWHGPPPPPRHPGNNPRAPPPSSQARNGGGQRGGHRDIRDVTCYNCREKGHYSDKCPQPKMKRAPYPLPPPPPRGPPGFRPPAPRHAPIPPPAAGRGHVNHISAEEAHDAPGVVVESGNEEYYEGDTSQYQDVDQQGEPSLGDYFDSGFVGDA